MGPAGHSYTEKKVLSWVDRSTVNTPHRGAKWFPFSGVFFFIFDGPCRDGQGGVRCGAVVDGWGHVEEG